ncbi:FAD-dependent oxidoreductase [Myxococcota bacterium]|nr:FAD-dependent oxidoreductase [Myxococcota bacterium]MBU1380244.1 FAD-dependent oxidoreductase [Myxococcota bacterium]MBU1499110.1 FAD-dependent oxidoreductase [Myxococcota bacterium]
MDPQRIVIIGGSAAGPKTAARARRLAPDAHITMIEAGENITMSSCGYPFYIGGRFDERRHLLETPTGILRDPAYFKTNKDIDVLINTEVTRIDRWGKNVELRNLYSGEVSTLPYDRLMISTGSTAIMPPVPGISLPGVTALKTLPDADYIRKVRDEKQVKNAVIIGGGLIGLETAEALTVSGIDVTVIDLGNQVLPFLDWELAKLVEKQCLSHGVKIRLETGVEAFSGVNGHLSSVKLTTGDEIPCELAIVAIGVKPNNALAREAGLKIGENGGIRVNKYMCTSDPNIYAAGDCVELVNSVSGMRDYSPKGDQANLQGRVAADNMIFGDTVSFPGTIGTGIGKIFDFAAGSAGLNHFSAEAAGFDAVSILNSGTDKPGFMGSKSLISKLTVERSTHRILGYQCVGKGDVSRQVSEGAMAISANFTVGQMLSLDLPYSPPFSPAIDHFIASVHIMDNKLSGLIKGIGSREVWAQKNGGELRFIDVRELDEFEDRRLGIGEILIPLSTLRRRLKDIPFNNDTPIVCYCLMGLRSYEAALILTQAGFNDVRVMEGGMMAWPFPREK